MLTNRVGTITYYDPKSHSATVHIDRGVLHRGDTIHIRGPGVSFDERITDLREGHQPVREAHAGDDARIHLTHRFGPKAAELREHPAQVLLVRDPYRLEDAATLAQLFAS